MSSGIHEKCIHYGNSDTVIQRTTFFSCNTMFISRFCYQWSRTIAPWRRHYTQILRFLAMSHHGIFVYNLLHCWFHDRASSQQLQMWFSEHFFARKLAALFVMPIVSATYTVDKYGAKKCLKNHIPFDFWDDSTLANQRAGKNNRKAFEGASTEPTNSGGKQETT